MGGCLISLGIRTLKEEGYREAVDDEILTRCRLKVCREEGAREAVEKRLGFGQVEELIEEALENLNLIYKMIGMSGSHGMFLKTMNVIKVNTVSQTCLLTLTLLTPNGVLQDGRGSLSIKGLNLWLSRLKLCLSQDLFSFETRDGRLIWNQVRIIHQVLDLCDLIRLGLYLSGVHGDLSLGFSQLTLGDTDLPLQHRYHPNTPVNWILHTPVGLQCNSICSLSSLLHWHLLQDIYAH